MPALGGDGSMKRASRPREPEMPLEIKAIILRNFRAGKSITEVQAVVGMNWGVRTLDKLRLVAK